MKHNSIYLAILLLVVASSAAAAERPNVILVMTDDQGYPELSAHGNPILKTPHLDRLHAESVRFKDFHVAPMCTPTRGQLMTGLDAGRNGAINVSSGRTLLRANLPTIADFFRGNGYRTGIFGKWHLGDNTPYRPEERGFEEALWFPSSHINSVPDFWNNDYFDDTYFRNTKRVSYKGYCTDVFFREAMAWMKDRAAAGEPFFTYIPTNAPHGPFWAPEKELAQAKKALEGVSLPKMNAAVRKQFAGYLAMIMNIDNNVGRLKEFLEDLGIAENTILVFLTDNGSTYGYRYFNAGMRGRKTELWEGGHRVPLFIRWPGGGFGAGRDVEGLTQVQDLLPTLIDLAELVTPTAPRFDGISLAPVLRGQAGVPEDRMLVINYSRMPIGFDYPSPSSPSIMRREGAAVLWKRWRLLADRELYDLASDPMQEKNAIAEHPEVAARMRSHLDSWWADVHETANEPQPVTIGSDAENPMMLSACEWLDVFVDQQGQIRRGVRKNGYWHIEVAKAGEYELELRRWPKEADTPLRGGLPAIQLTAGSRGPGAELPIARARILIDGIRMQKTVEPHDLSAVFNVNLKPGPALLHPWFDDENNEAIT
ncbi:MAG: arylsulfatase, partial [bacterium]|nr:arylsulfatase [bacterium]